MVTEVLVGLNCRAGHLYVDGTVGEGGHARAILERLAGGGELWGLDRDPEVLKRAQARLAPYASRFRLFHRSYAELGEILAEEGASRPAAGILLDLGLSLFSLQRSGRGFSFLGDEPLDMRFNPEEPGPTAASLLNRASQAGLEKIFREYGEEPAARRLATLVVQARQKAPFRTTQQFIDTVQKAQRPGRRRRGRLHIATRAFQALRIAVNRELDELVVFLANAPAWLEPGGRLVIISYHSLEDRLVKQHFLAGERAGVLRRLTKKPQQPAPDEIRRNPRARSAKLRVAEKL